MPSVGTIDLDLSTNTGPFQRQLSGISEQATGMVGGAFLKLGVIIATTFAITKLVEFGKSCVELASNLYEVQNVVDVTFRNMAGQVNNFAVSAITQFGLSELSAKKFTSTMGAMLKSSGLTGQKMTDMSIAITKLSADMASFYNLKAEDAFFKIRAGIAGETEPLRQLGINMSVANIEAYALSQGISTSYQKMSQASQILLRYNYLMSVSKDAQGDFARTSHSWANETRVLSEQWNVMKATMGQAFINALTPLLSVINKIIARLQIAAQYFRAFTAMIFGNAQAIGVGTGAATSGAAAIDSMGGAADATASKVKKAAAAVKGSLGTFDQLNVLGQKASDAADDSGGSDVGGGGGDFSIPDTSEEIKLPEIKLPDWLTKGLNFQPLLDSFEKLKIALAPLTKTLFSGLEWVWENILKPLGAWVIEDAAPAFLHALAGAVLVLNPLLLSFKPLAMWLWDNFLKPIAVWTGGLIVDTLNLIGDALTKLGTWMTNNQSTVDKITTSVLLFFAAWKGIELLAFIEMSGGVVLALKKIMTAIYAATVAKALDRLQTMALTAMYAKDLVVSLAASTLAFLKQTAQVLLSSAAMAAATIAAGIHSVAMGIAAAATWVFNAALAVLTSPITLVIAALVLLGFGIYELVKHWDKVKEAGAKCWEWIKEKWKEAGDWFYKSVVSPIYDFFAGMWDGVTSLFRAGANSALSALESFLNFAIKGFNKLILAWNWTKSALGISGWTMPMESIHIPRLANGGMVTQPTLALVGDNKNARSDPEVISPLSKLQEIVENAVRGALGSERKQEQSGDIILQVGETELGRVAIKAINAVHRQTGMTLLTI